MSRNIRLGITSPALALFAVLAICAPALGQGKDATPAKEKTEPAPKPPAIKLEAADKSNTDKLSFGQRELGSTSPVQTLTVTLDPPQDSSIKIKAATKGDFAVTPEDCDLKGTGKCTFSVSFSPKSEGQSSSALSITIPSGAEEQPRTINLEGEGIPCGQCTADTQPQFATKKWFVSISLVLAVVLLYLAGIVLIRWNMIARPTRNLLQAEIDGTRSELQRVRAALAEGGAGTTSIEKIMELLDKASDLIGTRRSSAGGQGDQKESEQKRAALTNFLDFILWNRGQEISAWTLVHDAQEQLSLIYPKGYESSVRADLEDAALNLQKANTEVPKGLADLIDRTLHPEKYPPPSQNPPANIATNNIGLTDDFERMKALLNEALRFLNDQWDTSFSSLISWHNKTIWLIGAGLLLIVSLGAALHREVFFLVGATGGLLSRLSRSLDRADVPTDYGASWTTLFLSPVVGALAGWSGVLLLILAFQLNVTGLLLKIEWCNPYCAVALGAALLMGVSERAFDGVLDQLNSKVKSLQTTAKPAEKDAEAKK